MARTDRQKASNAVYWNDRARRHDVLGASDADTLKARPMARVDGANVVRPDFNRSGIERRTTGVAKIMAAAIPAMVGGPMGWAIAGGAVISGINDIRKGAAMQRQAAAKPPVSVAGETVTVNPSALSVSPASVGASFGPRVPVTGAFLSDQARRTDQGVSVPNQRTGTAQYREAGERASGSTFQRTYKSGFKAGVTETVRKRGN